MITPDEVRGTTSTLVEAVLAKARGRVIFLMDQKGAGPIYVQGQPSLRGHILFTNAVQASRTPLSSNAMMDR